MRCILRAVSHREWHEDPEWVPQWLQQLLAGDWRSFDLVVEAACLKKIPARWLRFLLLLGGDIERNPGPRAAAKTPRGPLDLERGFAPSTVHKMRKALEALALWLLEVAQVSLEDALSTNEGAELALRGFGLHLYAEGHPRYLLVYAITAIQNRCPSYRNRFSVAWQIDKKWQDIEPGECRPVLPAAAVRALLCVTALWDWLRFSGLVLVGFLAMLHPTEMVQLIRKDLVFPSDTLGHTRALYVHLRKPKTARFARRQHGKIDDPFAMKVLATASSLVLCIRFVGSGMQLFSFSASRAGQQLKALPRECFGAPEPRSFIKKPKTCNCWLGAAAGLVLVLWNIICRRLQPSCSCRNWGPKLAFAFLPLIPRVTRCSARFLVLRSKGEVEVTGETLVCFYLSSTLNVGRALADPFPAASQLERTGGTRDTSNERTNKAEGCFVLPLAAVSSE
ncbi:Senp8 [Symbiodinium sp. CCMP2592]|nr:Senp8 [Symbiodinium sp. CCMP2592]